MQIKKINHLVIAAYLTITTLNIASFVQFDRLRLDAKGTIERHRKAGIEASRMIAGSDKLTNSVRDFAATGDPLHEKAYWREVKETQTIEKAEAALREMGLTDQEIDLIERAKINSDQLIKTEAQAFKAGLEGNLSLSVELVFGENYRKALASIYDPLEQFRLRLDKRLTAETVALERKVDVWWYVSLALSAINAALVIFFIGFFYNRRIVRPLICMKTEVKDMLDGRTSTGEDAGYDNAVEEIGALANSFGVLRETYRKAEESHWVKSCISDISTALQKSEDLRSLTQTTVSKVAAAVGAGHGAFYVADSENRYNLLASYGYRERKHLSNSFAVGEGLVGQCAMEKAPIMLTAPKDYIRINSGLGEGPPACVSVLPVIHGCRVLGVLEMASFQQFGAREKAVLEALLPTLATSMEILDRNLKTRELLTATQEQAERMEKQAAQLAEAQVEMEAQQAELLETENWFRSIIETAPDGMLVADASGQILLTNPELERIFGYASGELVGGSIEQLVPERMRGGHSGLRQAFMAEGRSRTMGSGSSTLQGRCKDGSEVNVAVTLSPLPPRGTRGECVSVSVRRISN
jgi:PAS domain S-box-containing protein